MYVPRISPDLLQTRWSTRDSVLSFGVSGILRDGALVMYDRATYSLWKQTGVAIAGPLEGQRLRRFGSERTTWGAWRQRHPHTLVMLRASFPKKRSR